VKPKVPFAVGAESVTHEVRREVDPGQDAEIVVEQANVGMTGRDTFDDDATRAPGRKQPAGWINFENWELNHFS
jgi:hypothetical protein